MSANGYLWLKAWHVIAVVAWYAGLFYIFRLYVYHVQNRANCDITAMLEIMERRLMRAIMLPAMFLAVGLGIAMLVQQPTLLQQPWMHLKLGGIMLLLGYHGFASWVRKKFAAGEYVLSEKACRWINEVPTILLFIIVIAVIVRP